MEGIFTLLGDIVAKFASFSEEHSFILAGFMIVTLFLIAGKMIESKKKGISDSFKNIHTSEVDVTLGDQESKIDNAFIDIKDSKVYVR